MELGVLAEVAGVGASLGPSSPQARAIADLFTDTLVVCGVIFAVVTGLIVYAIVRFRESADREASQIEGHTRLEMAWTAAPFVILIGIFFLTTRAMSASDPPADREPDLTVIGHQWWWEIRYRSGAVTANEIHIPTGKPLLLRIESEDVVHDFWVPDLARKIDATPGHPSNIWMQADTPGTYRGACAEYCGDQHAWMRILVMAESPDDFAAWEAQTRAPAVRPASESAVRGARLYRSMTCVKCHQIRGASAGVRAGPDLTHLASRLTLGAGVVENTPSELFRWLKHPQEVKPGSHMPDLSLSDGEATDLAAYFGALK